MPGPIDYTIWLICTLLEGTVVVCAFKTHSFRRYLFLNLYMGMSFLVSVGRFQVLHHYGMHDEYAYFYFYSDALLTIGLYFALLNLYSLVFDEMKVEKYLRLGAVLLLAGTAWFSYAVVNQSSDKLLSHSHFAFELSQNLYFVGLILTYVLWGAILKLRETRARLIQLVLALGVYFSAFAADYALRNLYANLQVVWQYTMPLLGCLLPAAWAYALLRVNEEARLAPSRLAAVPR